MTYSRRSVLLASGLVGCLLLVLAGAYVLTPVWAEQTDGELYFAHSPYDTSYPEAIAVTQTQAFDSTRGSFERQTTLRHDPEAGVAHIQWEHDTINRSREVYYRFTEDEVTEYQRVVRPGAEYPTDSSYCVDSDDRSVSYSVSSETAPETYTLLRGGTSVRGLSAMANFERVARENGSTWQPVAGRYADGVSMLEQESDRVPFVTEASDVSGDVSLDANGYIRDAEVEMAFDRKHTVGGRVLVPGVGPSNTGVMTFHVASSTENVTVEEPAWVSKAEDCDF